MCHVAFEFPGRAHVDQWLARLTLGQSFVGKGPDLLVETLLRDRVLAAGRFGNFARHRTLLRFPFVPATVQDFDFFVSKQTEGPKGITSPPVGLVAVENTGGIARNSISAAEIGEFIGRNVIAHHRVLQIGAPVDVHRARDVSGIINQDIFVRLDDPQVFVRQMLFQPVCIDQSLRVRIGRRFRVHAKISVPAQIAATPIPPRGAEE